MYDDVLVGGIGCGVAADGALVTGATLAQYISTQGVCVLCVFCVCFMVFVCALLLLFACVLCVSMSCTNC